MKFKRTDFNFLDLYVPCVDNKAELHDKFQIQGNEATGELIISQISMNMIIYTIIKRDVKEDFTYIFPTVKFNSLIKGFREEDEFDLEKGILIFKDSKYEFGKEDFEKNDISNFRNYLDDIKKEDDNKEFFIKELDKLNHVRGYIGQEGIDCVAIFNNHFIASNRTDVTAITKIESKIQVDGFKLSKLSVNILQSLKLQEILIRDFKDFYSFSISNTNFIIIKQEYILPNMFDEGIKKNYDHETFATIDKSKFLEILKRIKVVAQENISSRIFITFKNGYWVVESKDDNYAQEKIKGEYSKELEEHYIIVSSIYMNNIINSLEGERVTMNISPSKEIPAVKIVDEKNNKIFVHCLYNYGL